MESMGRTRLMNQNLNNRHHIFQISQVFGHHGRHFSIPPTFLKNTGGSPLSYELLVGWCKDSYFHLLYIIPLKTVGGFNLSFKHHISQLAYLPEKNCFFHNSKKLTQKSGTRFPISWIESNIQNRSKAFIDLAKNGRDSFLPIWSLSSGWLNHPSGKCARQIGSPPQVGVKKKIGKHLKKPSDFLF